MQKSSFVDVCLVSKYASGFRNSHQCSVEKAVLKNFAILTGKHLCWSLLIKLQAISCIQTEYEYLSVLVSFHIQSKCRGKNEKKKKKWLLLLFMAVVTYFYHEKVRRTIHTTIVLHLFNICAFKIKSN